MTGFWTRVLWCYRPEHYPLYHLRYSPGQFRMILRAITMTTTLTSNTKWVDAIACQRSQERKLATVIKYITMILDCLPDVFQQEQFNSLFSLYPGLFKRISYDAWYLFIAYLRESMTFLVKRCWTYFWSAQKTYN